jgi:hypothetical protein
MSHRSISCDVLVVGFGVAGMSAGIRAAREGVRTVLLEERERPGGTAVLAMHRFICGLYANGEDPPRGTLNGGIAAEVCAELKTRAPEKEVERMGRVHVLPVRSSDLVSTFLALSAGEDELEVLYGTRATAVAMEGDAIAAVRARGAAGEFEIVPGAVVDCSGRGAILEMSGARSRMPPAGGGQLGGFAFRLEGMRAGDELLALRVPYLLRKAVDELGAPPHLKYTTYSSGDAPDEGYCRLNVPSIGEDGNERARKDAVWVHGYLSRTHPAFERSRIAEMSPEVAEREGLRACGEYTLTADDVLEARKFPDGVVKSAWPIEFWDPRAGPSYRYLAPGEHYEIPLRCLEPQGISNCWCAGRCISASREALGSTRVMGTCLSLGEAAGREAARSA